MRNCPSRTIQGLFLTTSEWPGMNWHCSVFIITLKVLLPLHTELLFVELLFTLINYITDKNVQFDIKVTLRVSLQLTKWKCRGNWQGWWKWRGGFPLGKHDLSLVSKGRYCKPCDQNTLRGWRGEPHPNRRHSKPPHMVLDGWMDAYWR